MMAILTAILIAIASAISATYFFYRKQFQFWGDLNFTHTSPSFPMGDAGGSIKGKNMGEIIKTIYNKFPNEPFVGFWMLFRPLLLVRDPSLIKNICVKDFMTFHDRGMYANADNDPLLGHLFAAVGLKWKTLRSKLSPTFTSGKMKLMFPILVECCKQFNSALEKAANQDKIIEMKDYCARFTTDIISLVAFGIKVDSLHNPDAEFRHYGAKALEPTLKTKIRQFTMFMAPNIAELVSLRMCDKEIEVFFANAIKESMAYRENNKMKKNDFLDLLIQLKEKGKLDDDLSESDAQKFSFEDVLAQAFVFFVAGFETSSTTMQFALYELAKNPVIQQKVRDDINQALANHKGEINYDALVEMNYLSRVVDETLRMYPPLPILQRECNEDYRIPDSKLVIPKKTVVIIDVHGMQTDPKYYPQPEIFDPERFTEEGKASRPNYCYMPFGEGPRNCIGSRFGLMQTKVGIATLIKHFEFTVCDKTPINLEFDPNSIILSPLGGMHLVVNKIKN